MVPVIAQWSWFCYVTYVPMSTSLSVTKDDEAMLKTVVYRSCWQILKSYGLSTSLSESVSFFCAEGHVEWGEGALFMQLTNIRVWSLTVCHPWELGQVARKAMFHDIRVLYQDTGRYINSLSQQLAVASRASHSYQLLYYLGYLTDFCQYLHQPDRSHWQHCYVTGYPGAIT